MTTNKRDLLNKQADLQHEYHDVIFSIQHFHFDHDNCLEIIAVRGESAKLILLANKLIVIKGIQHGKLKMSNTV